MKTKIKKAANINKQCIHLFSLVVLIVTSSTAMAIHKKVTVDLSAPEITSVAGKETLAYKQDKVQPESYTMKLDSTWRFAIDPFDQGMAGKWYAENFDDSKWKTLKSGASWESQSVIQHGWGWYRQKLFIPEEYRGVSLVLRLGDIPADDNAFVNGINIGGINGGYKYKNMQQRKYIVPASLLQYGQVNILAVRVWGGKLTYTSSKSGLVKGPFTAELNPFTIMASEPGLQDYKDIELFDLTNAQKGNPFEMVFRFPKDVLDAEGALLKYSLKDFYGIEIAAGEVPVTLGTNRFAEGIVNIDGKTAQTIYLRGRFVADWSVFGKGKKQRDTVLSQMNLPVADWPISSKEGKLLCHKIEKYDHLSFTLRDTQSLPQLGEKWEATPYGKLRLVDEIDCSQSLADEIHPYLQSGFDEAQLYNTPGSAVDIKITEILGKKARESGNGWFAYRIGRGKLTLHNTYLLRIEYPEDMSRYCPVEVQVGQNYMDVGWENGVGLNDPYDNWPLSNSWQWYDLIIPNDDETTGTGGSDSASAGNGFWVYFMNKLSNPPKYYSMYNGGPAIARIKLYEIDSKKNAPVICKPAGLQQRTLMFDWERQPEHEPADLVRYAKLMGYNAISPVIIKWTFANYSEPLNGYNSVNIDDRNYSVWADYKPETGENAKPAIQGKESIHVKYLEATKKNGINYVPRIEYGGSLDLPEQAYAIGSDGKLAKPNRYASWCSDLLNPLTFEDMKRLTDHLIKPYAQDNPQLTGILWRIRCDRMPISYSRPDINLFSKESRINHGDGTVGELAAWASTGDIGEKYADWWHRKRKEFHSRLVDLLKSYRSDMKLYYFNWDNDKFGLILPDTHRWAFLVKAASAASEGKAKPVYEKDREARSKITADEYSKVMYSGNMASGGDFNSPDYGLRPDLYKNTHGIELLAPVNILPLADKPEYLNYFHTADGVAVSNNVSYDEVGARTINPKFEGHMITPGGAAYSMAIELLSWFNSDARTLTYTVYTYGRGFADAHRRFAQAFLALPAIEGTVIEGTDKDLKIRVYSSKNGTYIGVASKAYTAKNISIRLPANLLGGKKGFVVKDLVTGSIVPSVLSGNELMFEVQSEAMQLNAFLIQ